MGAAQRRTWEGLALLGLVALSIRPIPAVERLVDLLLVPTRPLAELTTPLGTAQALAAGGAASVRADRRASEERDARALERALRNLAHPDELEALLPPGVRGVHAEVLSRPDGVPDEVQVLLAEVEGLRRGLPVVCGANFVGVLERMPTPDAPGLAGRTATVRLITERTSRVCGLSFLPDAPRVGGGGPPRPTVEHPGSPLVVGGVTDAPEAGRWLLAVHHPELPDRVHGEVVLEDDEWPLSLANGFRLGDLVAEARPYDERRSRVAGLRPRLDLESGLYQLVVLTDAAAPPEEAEAHRSGRWEVARQGLRGDADPGRVGRKLLAGRTAGVRPGAAVALDQRFLGRVERAGLAAADVRRVEDPGLVIPGVALPRSASAEVDAAVRPIVLGDLTSLGLDGDGRLRLLWDGPVTSSSSAPTASGDPSPDPDDPGAPRPVRLWTGSGAPGVPRGLLLGDATLPPGPGPHVLLVDLPPGGREAGRVRVRVDWEVGR